MRARLRVVTLAPFNDIFYFYVLVNRLRCILKLLTNSLDSFYKGIYSFISDCFYNIITEEYI